MMGLFDLIPINRIKDVRSCIRPVDMGIICMTMTEAREYAQEYAREGYQCFIGEDSQDICVIVQNYYKPQGETQDDRPAKTKTNLAAIHEYEINKPDCWL